MEKNTSSLMAGMILCGASLMSGGCQKAIDYIKNHENGQVDCKACNIQQISVLSTDELGAYTVTYAFNYNTAGDPLTVKNYICMQMICSHHSFVKITLSAFSLSA